MREKHQSLQSAQPTNNFLWQNHHRPLPTVNPLSPNNPMHCPRRCERPSPREFYNFQQHIRLDDAHAVPQTMQPDEMLVCVLIGLITGRRPSLSRVRRLLATTTGWTSLGSDVSVEVVAVPYHQIFREGGDYVVCRFDEPQPNGGLGEYLLSSRQTMVIGEMSLDDRSEYCACPPGRPCIDSRRQWWGRYECDSVRQVYGASFVAAVSTQTQLYTSLGADHQVLDYRVENWWDTGSGVRCNCCRTRNMHTARWW